MSDSSQKWILKFVFLPLFLKSSNPVFKFSSLLQNCYLWSDVPKIYCLFSWGCRIHRLHLCRGVRLLPWVSWYTTLNNPMVLIIIIIIIIRQKTKVPVLIPRDTFCVSEWSLPIFTFIVLSVKNILPYLLFYNKHFTIKGFYYRNLLQKVLQIEIFRKKCFIGIHK